MRIKLYAVETGLKRETFTSLEDAKAFAQKELENGEFDTADVYEFIGRLTRSQDIRWVPNGSDEMSEHLTGSVLVHGDGGVDGEAHEKAERDSGQVIHGNERAQAVSKYLE